MSHSQELQFWCGGKMGSFQILGSYEGTKAVESFINLHNLPTGEPLRFNRLERCIEVLDRDTGVWREILSDLVNVQIATTYN